MLKGSSKKEKRSEKMTCEQCFVMEKKSLSCDSSRVIGEGTISLVSPGCLHKNETKGCTVCNKESIR